MPDDNKKKTIINFVSGLGSQMIVLILGLVVPRIILTNYGSDTNGFISTITQIFTYMALLEAGISASSRNALYKPIKENDKQYLPKYNSLTVSSSISVVSLNWHIGTVYL
jgi:hypothetical protein